jgi:hypothetical protein
MHWVLTLAAVTRLRRTITVVWESIWSIIVRTTVGHAGRTAIARWLSM